MNDEEKSDWQYTPQTNESSNQPGNGSSPPSKGGEITWTAAEYIEHERGAGWYLALLLISAAIAAGFYFLTKDYFAVGTAVIVGIIVAVAAGKKPRQITYEVTNKGLRVGEKLYAYSLFKSFSIAQEEGLNSLNLLPLKRFMPIVSVYFQPQDQDRISNAIGEHLPLEAHKLDSVDRLARRLHF